MLHFLPLVYMDTQALVASMPTREGLFRPGTPRIVPIREPRKGTTEADEDFVWLVHIQKWVAMKNFLGRMQREAERLYGTPIEYGHIWLEMLDSRDLMPWQDAASGPYSERHMRIHIALRTNPLATMIVGHEAFSPAPGWLTVVSTRAPSAAINMGDWPRVHLVVDARKKEAAE